MNIWTVKAREYLENGDYGWHWDRYFPPEGRTEIWPWGGKNWIRNNKSRQRIRDEVREGDLIVCYQFEKRQIVGFTRMARDGQEEDEGSGRFNILPLPPRTKAFALARRVSVTELREHDCSPACYGTEGAHGTIFPVEPGELDAMVKIIASLQDDGGEALRAWLGREALDTSSIAATPVAAPHTGAGFGDHEQNAETERAAVDYVTELYEDDGWSVESVESEGCGYDLRCRKGKQEHHVEVKGVGGDQPTFIITAGEVRAADQDKHWRLCLVLRARDDDRECHEWSGRDFLKKFGLDATQYRAMYGGEW